MASRCRPLIAWGFVALGALWSAWLGFGAQTGGDYPVAFAPPMNALLAGHLHGFFALLPLDGAGGSVVLRAPFAAIGKVVGGQLAEFRFGALECVLACGVLGLVLVRRMRGPVRAQAAVLCVCVLSPAALDAIRFGHPEEALGAALCVGGVLLAGEGRTALAGALLGLALVNKPWALLAIGPVLLAAPAGRAGAVPVARVIAVAGVIACAWVAAAWLLDPARLFSSLDGLGKVAHPAELWWPLAHLRSTPGLTPAAFLPQLVSDHARDLVVALGILLSVRLARRRARTTEDCLALLALLFLLRCLLDPSNHVYYQLPMVLALAAWEARTRGLPVLALAATAGYWLVFHEISGPGSETLQFVAYLLLSLALARALTARPQALTAHPRANDLVNVPIDATTPARGPFHIQELGNVPARP